MQRAYDSMGHVSYDDMEKVMRLGMIRTFFYCHRLVLYH